MSKINILIGVPNKGLQGGPQGHLPYLVQGLKDLDANVTEIIYGSRRNTKTIISKIFDLLKTLNSFYKNLKKNKIDIIHLNTAFDLNALMRDFIILLFIKNSNKKIFMKFHGSDSNLLKSKNPILKFMTKKISLWSNGFGVLSTEEKRNFIKAGFNTDKIFVTKNIVKSESYIKNSQFRLKYSITNIPILLFVARLIPAKGLIDTLKAAKILNEKGYLFKLIVLGDGPERQKAEKLALNLEIANFVIFKGYIPEENTKSYYSISNVLVFPTYHEEGFPMAVFQSVAAGLPIITTKIRAAADYLKEPDNCLWIEPKNPEKLAEKIIYLLDNPNIAENMSKNNKEASKLFTQAIVSQEFENIYKKLLLN